MGGKINFWALDKHPSIKALLLMLQHRVGPENILLLDEDKLDNQAVRIAAPGNNGEVAVYIYTYAQRAERYGLDLEFPQLIETGNDDQSIRLDDQGAEKVLRLTIAHLELCDKDLFKP